MTESSARAIAAGLAGALSSHGREELADAAFTLACGQRVVLPTHAFESQDGASADARGEEEERAAGGKEGR